MKNLPLLVFPILLLTACQPSPKPIEYGSDACDFCKMTIVDPRFGAEAITEKGKLFKFAAIECMLNFIHSNQSTDYVTYVTDFDNPKMLMASSSCTFLMGSDIASPMGMFLTAHSTGQSAQSHQQQHGGNVLPWNELLSHFDNMARTN